MIFVGSVEPRTPFPSPLALWEKAAIGDPTAAVPLMTPMLCVGYAQVRAG
jgi:hypothetical protein